MHTNQLLNDRRSYWFKVANCDSQTSKASIDAALFGESKIEDFEKFSKYSKFSKFPI